MSWNPDHFVHCPPRVGGTFRECTNVLCFELGDILIALVLLFVFGFCKDRDRRG